MSNHRMSSIAVRLFLAISAGIPIAACQHTRAVNTAPGAAPPTAQSLEEIELRGAGSTAVYPIMSKWIADYAQRPSARVSYLAVGSGEGQKQILNRDVDFGASDVPLTDEELARAPAPVTHVPIVLGAVVIAYNRQGLPARLKLSRAAIAGIFLGEIRKWDDPRIAVSNRDVRLPDLDIDVIVRSDGSGTTAIVSRYLSDASDDWRTRTGEGMRVSFPVGKPVRGNEGMATALTRGTGTVGYLELAYARRGDLGLGYASIENPAGKLVEPALDSIAAAAAARAGDMPGDLRTSLVDAPGDDSYPMSAFTYALVFLGRDDASEVALRQFLWWVVHDGQRVAPERFFAPLPAELVERIERTLRAPEIAERLAIP